jgi:hypothetical protein
MGMADEEKQTERWYFVIDKADLSYEILKKNGSELKNQMELTDSWKGSKVATSGKETEYEVLDEAEQILKLVKNNMNGVLVEKIKDEVEDRKKELATGFTVEGDDLPVKEMKCVEVKKLENNNIVDVLRNVVDLKVFGGIDGANARVCAGGSINKIVFNDKNGNGVYVMERFKNDMIRDGSAYSTENFYFRQDFDKNSALSFLKQYDEYRKSLGSKRQDYIKRRKIAV